MALLSNTGSTGVDDEHSRFIWLAAAGSIAHLDLTGGEDPFDTLYRFHEEKKDWLFGHFGYGLKDLIVRSATRRPDPIGFADCFFFQPRYVVTRKGETSELHYFPQLEEEGFIDRLEQAMLETSNENLSPDAGFSLQQRISREEYLARAGNILRHIQRGDIYEANFCMEFHRSGMTIDTIRTFLKLNELSPMPNAVYYKSRDRYLLCSSPERFLQKQGYNIISQPIKGTIRRGKNPEEDEILKSRLLGSKKEQAENVMITDLVRNDLSRTAKRGSVRVAELFGLKSYRQIHQLVSTIAAEMDPASKWTDVIRHAFPMGSMTGAPKVRALEIIEEQEAMPRGLYSGSIGYITPQSDFDLNVVIRSIQYNATTGYISAMTGSALTAGCIPEEEYDECLLKAETMKKSLD